MNHRTTKGERLQPAPKAEPGRRPVRPLQPELEPPVRRAAKTKGSGPGLIEYGLVFGLACVIGTGSLTVAGTQVDRLLDDVGHTLSTVHRQSTAWLGAPPSTPHYPGLPSAPTPVTAPIPAEGNSPRTERPAVLNPFLNARQHPLSTFGVDVDTASYARIRQQLRAGQRPSPESVRLEELVNYFDYEYPEPVGDTPFSANVEVATCPWNPNHRLARVGLKGRSIPKSDLAPSNLVFLLDVSGSMDSPGKLGLLKQGLAMLIRNLSERDRVAVVVYAGATGLLLPSTPCSDRARILDAVRDLTASGSTNGGAGIQLAYKVARENFIEGGVNRVILATDGDFNVGVRSPAQLTQLIRAEAKSGVFLSVLGLGMDSYQDHKLEQLSGQGNGNYAYIDSLDEARKTLVREIGGTLVTIAKDVKIQVEFNPEFVSSYRLLGYENRRLASADFHDDTKDAGEIGAGHTVTALYELVPPEAEDHLRPVDPLKYQQAQAVPSQELMTVKLRYKQPDGSESRLLSFPVVDEGLAFQEGSNDFRFATAVTAWGLMLRGDQHRGRASLAMVRGLASQALGRDQQGYRQEFLGLLDHTGKNTD